MKDRVESLMKEIYRLKEGHPITYLKNTSPTLSTSKNKKLSKW